VRQNAYVGGGGGRQGVLAIIQKVEGPISCRPPVVRKLLNVPPSVLMLPPPCSGSKVTTTVAIITRVIDASVDVGASLCVSGLAEVSFVVGVDVHVSLSRFRLGLYLKSRAHISYRG
jgi:hypothetical protein